MKTKIVAGIALIATIGLAAPALADDPEHSYLLPIEGVFWRRSPPDSFWQRYQKFELWMVAQGDSVPFLPKRPGGD